jgi:HrpA-like RNA helicase
MYGQKLNGFVELETDNLEMPSSNCGVVASLIEKLSEHFEDNSTVKSAVLVFLPGIMEINMMHDQLE